MKPIVVLVVFIAAAWAQGAPGIVGTWRGESLCMVKPSPYHDETVIYDISASPDKNGRFAMKASKIVAGKEDWMGTLDCGYAAPNLTCELPQHATWRFTFEGERMSGTLTLADGRLFRKVSARRFAPPK